MEREKLTYEDRKKMYIDACTFNKPKRVLLNAYQMGWMYVDAGMTLDWAARDYYASEVAMDTFMEKYPVDALGTASNGFRYHYRFTDPLGHSGGYSSNESLNTGNVNAIFENLISPQDYDEFMENPTKVKWEKALFNLYPSAKDLSAEGFARAIQEVRFLAEAKEKVNTRIRDKWGVLIPYPDSSGCGLMIDDLFNIYRGIKGLAMDMRRCPEKVYEVCDYFDTKTVDAAISHLEALPDGPGEGIKNYYDIYIGSLAHTMLNEKQIEKLYIKPWKRYFEAVEKKGKNIYANIEGGFLGRNLGELFGECKKGTLMMTVEMDDPYEVRKAYPNLGIFGGLNVDVLGNGTAEESVAMAKRAIDELGSEGGLYLSANKMVSYRYDMKSENIKAVAEFVCQYNLR